VTASARRATFDDLPSLELLYRGLEAEMSSLSSMWSVSDALPEPASDALSEAVGDDDTLVLIGTFDGLAFGFLVARVESLLPQGGDELIGSMRLVYVAPEAREVGIGEAMRELAMSTLRLRGISRFDAHVLPGHRLAKNFFEQGGFSARHIVMHHDDRATKGERATRALRGDG
jgi:ribosomal protein S18 acetylase RimI-like enzyme